MKIKYTLIISLIMMWTAMLQPAAAVQIIPASEDRWTCVDYSRNFAARNPDWGIVTMANDQLFRGGSHMVNYKIDPNNPDMLLIHDGLYNADYNFGGWYSYGFYHFWLKGETPVRNYIFLRDNSDVILKAYNITVQA